MALWTSYPVDTGDRDPSFAWHDTDVPSAGLDDSQHDLFAQFLDFEAGHGTTGGMNPGPVAAIAAEPFYLDQNLHGQQHDGQHDGMGGGMHHESSTTSSGVSNADDFDFFSSSSNPAAGYEVDPSALAMFAQDPAAAAGAMYAATSGVTVSDSELERLEGISLHSPKKGSGSGSDPSSPTPPNAAAAGIPASDCTRSANATSTNQGPRKSKKLVEALSSTIRKATNIRKTRRVSQALQRAVSPSLENPPMAMKPNHQQQAQRGRRAHTQHGAAFAAQQQQFPVSPPLLQVDTSVAGNNFVTGQFDDPFGGEISPTHAPQQQQQHQQQQMRYHSQGGLGTPMDSPTRHHQNNSTDGGSHPGSGMAPSQAQWQQQHHSNGSSGMVAPNSAQWSAAGSDVWWGGAGPGTAGGGAAADPENIDANMAMHSQHGELPYDVHSDGGLMIHMPQPRQGSDANQLALTAQTYLPPPPPVPASDPRSTRPPRAPSSGARHRNMSSSPMRKQRAPSASPSPGAGAGAGGTRQSRNSSGASASSRSASGRQGSVPGTPSGVKKRRSRDAGSGSFSAAGFGGSDDGGGGGIMLGGGGGIGFVNFTPNDGSMLMTGVAPSGSSKTKARREKEAQDRRRRLSEAAMKAVAAAGGDIEKLREQGFEL